MKRIESFKKHKKSRIFNISLVILVLLIALFFIRLASPRHLDDVHPSIQCDGELLQKADIFYVIPIFENVRISDNPEWCTKMLSYNKALALHGVYHTYNEFKEDRNEAYLQEGADEFKKCFGFYPTRFKAPQTTLSAKNKDLIVLMGYKVDTLFGDTFHKVYHCSDLGYAHNWVSDLI